MANKKRNTKKAATDLTLWDVILSYPDLHDPKPFKGKIYYRTDVLLDKDHAQLAELRSAIKKIKTEQWGEDPSEWPKASKPLIQNGDERKDQKGYANRFYITPSTQTPVPVIDPKGKPFNPQMVKGGMFANVAIRISSWEFDGDEGVSIYLQGVQIDTSKQSLNFGGGKTVKQMFDLEDENEESSGYEDDEEEEEDRPRSKNKPKSQAKNFDEDEDHEEDVDSDI